MCMCDENNDYLCFECEEYLISAVKDLIHVHKNDILDTNDWWWGIDDLYDVNVFCYEDDPDSPDAVFSINLYKLNLGHTSSYDLNTQYDLDPMTRREIRLA